MKKSLILLLIAALVLTMSSMIVGCDETTTAETTAAETTIAETTAAETTAAETTADGTGEKKFIGFSIHFKLDDYGVICSDGFNDAVKDSGYDYEILDAGGDPAKQLADIESFIAKGADVIGVSPMDETAIKDVCNEAASKGIKVISITTMPDTDITTTINTGNYEFSKEVAEILVEKLGGKGKIAILDISMNLWRIDQRLQGFQDVLADTDIEVVAIEKKLTQDEGMAAAEAILTAHPDINGIFGTFSNMVYGAAAAAKAKNRTDLIIGGVDADMSILHLMKEGWVYATAAQFPYDHGEATGLEAISILQGNEPKVNIDVPYKIYTDADLAAQEVWNKTLD